MGLEIGSIVEGTVTGIANFGAFVELPDKKVGLVHISEVSSDYVNDVNDYLKVHDVVKVKVIAIDAKGKIALSIKQAQPAAEKHTDRGAGHPEGHREVRHAPGRPLAGRGEGRPNRDFHSQKKHEIPASFEDKLSRFLKDSDERLLDLKRNVESKRGGRGARRAD